MDKLQKSVIYETSRILEIDADSLLSESMEKYLPFMVEELAEILRNNRSKSAKTIENLCNVVIYYRTLSVFDMIMETAEISPKVANLFEYEAKDRIVKAYFTKSYLDEKYASFFEYLGVELYALMETVDLPNVAKLIDVPLADVKKLSHDTQAQMCDMFSKRYKADGDNLRLIEALNGIMVTV